MKKNVASIRVLSSTRIDRNIMKPVRRLLTNLRISRVVRRVILLMGVVGICVGVCLWGFRGDLGRLREVGERGVGVAVGWSSGNGGGEKEVEVEEKGRDVGGGEFLEEKGRDVGGGELEMDEREEESEIGGQQKMGERKVEILEEEVEEVKDMEVVVVVRGGGSVVKDGLERLLGELSEAQYDGERVNLRVVSTRGSGEWMVREFVEEFKWEFGSKVLVNSTRASSGYFSGILTAWTPQRGDNTPVVIMDLDQLLKNDGEIEAQSSKLVSPMFYRYVKSARARYNRRPDVGAYALEPTEIRAEPSLLSFSKHSTVPIPKDTLTYLYQSAGGVGALAPFDSETWRTFLRWFEAHRSDWFLWPVIKHEPKSKKDPAWKTYRGNHRAHWTLWWSRFCVEHELFNLYPSQLNPTQLPAIPTDSKKEKLPRYSHKGVLKPEFSGPGSEDLERIVEKARGKSVAVTVVNDAFVATAQSWVCNVKGAGISPSEILFLATDKYSYDTMKKVDGADAVFLQTVKGGGKGGTGTSYGTPGYWLLMLERTQLISRILNAGVALLAFETDQIWLRDPMPYIRRLINGGDEVDMVGTLDSYNEIGGNFLYLNPTLATRRLWREIAFRFKLSYIKNKVAQRMRSSNIKPRYIENDQSILTKLVFYNETFRRWTPIVFRTLDKEIFVDGKWYDKFDKGQLSDLSRSPVMINNNFIVGIPRKRHRAFHHGHWFWNETTRVCDTEAVKKAVDANEERGKDSHAEENINTDIDVSVDEALGAIG